MAAPFSPKVQVQGGAELRRALRRMGNDLSDLKAVHREAADKVVGEAKARVPVVSGELGASIRAGATKTRGYVAAGKKLVPYAGPIHFGWPARNIEAQPFLYDALDDRREQITTLYERRVGELVLRLDMETPG